MTKMHLFHSISENAAENAAIRKFVSDRNLKDQIEFHNLFYESSQKKNKELGGDGRTPCLIAGENIYIGAADITKFLSAMQK